MGLVLFMGLSLHFHTYAQFTITGKVSDADGKAVSNASVNEKGSDNGTLTNQEGLFRLNLASQESILVVSHVGFITTEIYCKGDSFLNIVLEAAYLNLEDIIVIGYGTTRRRDLTGAITSVSEKEFNKGIYSSPDQLLSGKVAGLQITKNNGQPGGATTIKIRGNAALSGTGQPLFVIDGVPLDARSMQAGNNPLNFINPDDVASMEVLKDASASAIYGSRAAYGVILINTKPAQAGLPVISAGMEVGISSGLKKIDVLNAEQFKAAIQYYNVDTSFNRGGSTDAMDAISQTGFQSSITVGVSGGNENANYRISGDALNMDGILAYTHFKKYGLDLSSNYKFLESKNLGLNINLYVSQYSQSGPGLETGSGENIYLALKWNPTEWLRNPDGTYNRANDGNPLARMEWVKNNLKVTTILASISPSYRITKWLDYKLLFSINYSSGISRSSINEILIPPGQPPGTASIKNSELITNQITQTLSVKKEIAKHFVLDAVAGFEYISFNNKGFSVSGNGVPNVGLGNFGIDYTNYIQYTDLVGRSIASYADPTSSLQSFFGRTFFNYQEKYLLTATLRADGSSKFGKNNRYGYFPSFAAAWVISNEKFLKFEPLNLLKLRAGWGITGNQEFPAGSAQARYSFSDAGVLRLANNPNPDLKWQADRQFDIGLDVAMLESRISFSIDYYNKSTTHLLFPSPPIQPAPPDAVVRWINLDGSIQNRGWEIQLNANIVQHKDFGFDLGFNIAFNKNRVSRLPARIYTGMVSGPVQIIENGFPMNTFYTRKFKGIDKNTGFSTYEDDGVRFFHLGSPNPKTILGINPALRYRRFSFSATLYGAFGQKVFFAPLMGALNVGGIALGNNIGLDVYKNPEKESLANPSQSPSSRFIFSGNYLKLAHLTVNYRVGGIKQIVKDINMYLTGQNLFILTKYPGFDPEINSDRSINGIPSLGIDYLEYPSARTFICGLKFSL